MKSKPIIRWAGSKRKLLSKLIANAPLEYNKYIEPFCGSACLFFELAPKEAILGDLNKDLILALSEIRNNAKLREQLLEIPKTKEEYYRVRAISADSLCNTDRAIRFLYLNRYCFNGIYRTNMKGMFNVPMGTKTGDFPSEDTFEDAKKKLEAANIIESSYSDTLNRAAAGDFVYMDPPYCKGDRFTGEYGLGSFTGKDMESFIQLLDELNSKKVKFLFSYRLCTDLVDELSKKYNVEPITVSRHISGINKFRGEAQEMLVKNYEI